MFLLPRYESSQGLFSSLWCFALSQCLFSNKGTLCEDDMTLYYPYLSFFLDIFTSQHHPSCLAVPTGSALRAEHRPQLAQRPSDAAHHVGETHEREDHLRSLDRKNTWVVLVSLVF